MIFLLFWANISIPSYPNFCMKYEWILGKKIYDQIKEVHSFIQLAMSTPSADSNVVCAVCKKTASDANIPNLKKCSRCFSVVYCGAECQKADWKTHKPNCKPAASNSDVTSNTTNPDQVRIDLERMRQILLAQAQMNSAMGGHGHSHAPGQSCNHNHSHAHSHGSGQHNHSHSHAGGQHNHLHSHAPGERHNHSHSHAPGQSCNHNHSHGDHNHGHAHSNPAMDAAALDVAGKK
jgi:hypothetical protein